MKVLITGTDGFIGKRLKKSFTNALEFKDEDIIDVNWLDKETPEAVFHVGACSNTLETDVNYIMKVNFESTKVLVDWCKQNKRPIIYSSSAASYGVNGKYPSNLYGWSKYTAEQYVISNKGVALRYFNVYGPGEEHKGNMSSMAYQMFKSGQATLFPGEPKRDFIYIDDVVAANIYALKYYGTLSGNNYDVGLGKSTTFETIAEYLKIPYSYYPQEKIPEGYQMYTCSDSKKWMPGWAPAYDIKTGLKSSRESWQIV